MEVVDISPALLETILATFHTDAEKELSRQIVRCFAARGLPVKVKQYHQPCMNGTYRILCFIKKSAEAVIINNKGMGCDGVSVQVRIDDRSVLDRLQDLNENIRNQIINAADCGGCSTKCEGKKYVFAYQGKEYTKCRFICNNFCFQNIEKDDISDLMSTITNEIVCKQARSK